MKLNKSMNHAMTFEPAYVVWPMVVIDGHNEYLGRDKVKDTCLTATLKHN